MTPGDARWDAPLPDGGGAYLSEAIATIDPSTGAASVLGSVDTRMDDLDQLVWLGAGLVGLDVQVGVGSTLYDVSTSAGTTTARTDVSDVVDRVAFDAASGTLFGVTRESPRRLVTIDSSTGALTPVGTTHADTEHGGHPIDALFVAPAPTCP